jgi:CRP-like cAMP-binding protein/uncharacterized protein (DUF2225 family)
MLDIGRLAKAGTLKRYGTDEIIFHQGDPGHEMYILLKGRVKLLVATIDGDNIPVMELSAGDFFGEMSLLEDAPRSATIQALEDSLVIVIDESNFEEIIAQQPALAFRIMKGMSSRIRQLNDDLAQLKDTSAIEPVYVNEPDSVLVTALTQSEIPADQRTYPDIAPAADMGFIFDKEVACPVCGQKFITTMVRSSKLKLQSVEADLRQVFEGFNPLWYMVWVCPHCYYANFNFEFKQVRPETQKLIPGLTERFKATGFSYSTTRRLDEVLSAYYLVLDCLQTDKDAARIAKVWLRLSWLYDDAGDREMYRYASARALEYFGQTYYNGRRDSSVEQDQRLTLLLAELSLRTGQPGEALKHYRNSIVRKGGSPIINRQAEDKIQELKKLLEKA